VVKIWLWITENWKMFALLMGGLVFLSITGNITITLRSAKQGLKQLFTPLGFFVAVFIVVIAVIIYNNIVETFG
jgi:hypothetical protein